MKILTLDLINTIFIGIFTFEIVVRFLAKEFRIYMKDNINTLDIICIWFCIANLVIRNDQDINFYFRRIFNACCVAY